MRFTLILDFTGLTYYGHIPNTPFPPDPRIDEYFFDIEKKDMDSFEEDFINPVDALCKTLIDFSDVEFLDADKCVKLKDWLEERFKKNVLENFRPIYEKLLDYTSRAIALKTGVVIEL